MDQAASSVSGSGQSNETNSDTAGLTCYWSHLLVSDWLPQGAGRGLSGLAVSPGVAASTVDAATSGPAPATALLAS